VTVPIVPHDAPRPVIEMIEAILANQEKLSVYEKCRGLLYIDYAPGDVQLRIDKLSLKPVEGVRYVG